MLLLNAGPRMHKNTVFHVKPIVSFFNVSLFNL